MFFIPLQQSIHSYPFATLSHRSPYHFCHDYTELRPHQRHQLLQGIDVLFGKISAFFRASQSQQTNEDALPHQAQHYHQQIFCFFDSATNTASFPWSLQAFGKRSDASPIFIFKGTMAFIYCQKTKNIALQRFSLQKNFLVPFDNSLFHRTVLYYR